jgi:NADH dehydrogenase
MQAWSLEHLPGRLMTRDNVRAMQVPNVCSDPSAVPAGLVPQALEAVAPSWLAPLGSRARYPQLRWRARR